jgi:nucleotide-binding universal stress UspA family protein
MYQRILVPTDGSDASDRAVRTAISLASALGATLYTVTVSEPFAAYAGLAEAPIFMPDGSTDEQQRRAQARIDAVRTACAAAGIGCEAYVVEATHPWEAIIEQASRHGADLIVMASHGHLGLGGLLRGSETPKVLSHTTLPVLVVR